MAITRTWFGSFKAIGASVAIAAAFGTFAIPHNASAETLADALVGAYNHSGLLDQNRALLRAADEDVATSLAALKPIVSWQADIQQSIGNNNSAATLGSNIDVNSATISISIALDYQLFDFGADSARVAAAKESVLATRAGLLSVEQNVLLRAVSAFMNLRRTIETVALRENNLRLLTEELRAAKDRFDVGEVTRTDVALAEARLAQARSGLAAAQGDFVQAQEEYRNAVGRKARQLSPPPPLPATANLMEEARSRALRQHPDIVAAQRQVASAELLVNAAERDMLPTLSLRGTAFVEDNIHDDGYNNNLNFGLRATGPIYQGGRLSALARRSAAIRDSQRANLHVVRHNVEADLGNSFARLMAAVASLEASERQIIAARVAFRGIREEASLGARTTLDVLDAEQELLDAQAAKIAAQADQYIAAYSVLAAMGELTAERLKLPVKLYDPAAYYKLVKEAPHLQSKQGKALDRVLKSLQKN
ncbi:MAG: TolC family outer membrane protein [Rhodobacteraceae bacterium]|nr:TolC family outer membrane protein [Paracoccaceae bacterium]